jgi:Ca2+-transporting ATPase
MTVVRGVSYQQEFDLEGLKSKFLEEVLPSITSRGAMIKMMAQSININSSAAETQGTDKAFRFVGSKTEIAMLEMTRNLGFEYPADRSAAEIVHIAPFSSENKRMSTVVKTADFQVAFSKPEAGGYLLHTKGASEIILKDCDRYVDAKGNIVALTPPSRELFEGIIEGLAEGALRTIGVAVKPLDYKEGSIPEESAITESRSGLILIGIFGIADPVRPEVPGAVAICQRAGIIVRYSCLFLII